MIEVAIAMDHCLLEAALVCNFQGGTEPCIFKVDQPGIQADRLLRILNLLAKHQFSSLSIQLGIYPAFCRYWHPIMHL